MKSWYIPVWAYETGTFHMLICDETDEKNFPAARGIIIVNQYFMGSIEALGTLHNFSTGINDSEIVTSWTIESVIGYGNSLSIIFPTILFVALTVYQAIHSETILTASRYVAEAIFLDPRVVGVPAVNAVHSPRWKISRKKSSHMLQNNKQVISKIDNNLHLQIIVNYFCNIELKWYSICFLINTHTLSAEKYWYFLKSQTTKRVEHKTANFRLASYSNGIVTLVVEHGNTHLTAKARYKSILHRTDEK